MGDVVARIGELLKAQQQTQSSQTTLITQMQTVWPRLLEDVARSIKDNTDRLNSSWASASEKLANTTNTYISGLEQSVEELAENVGQLKQAVTSQTVAGRARS